MAFDRFVEQLETGDIIASLRAGIIGEGTSFETPFGSKRLIYADYTASGRALKQVEQFILDDVLPFYANSHTDASFCGAYITDMREQGRAIIAQETNAGDDCSVIFSGSGATSAINRLVALTGIADLKDHSPPPVVFIGPYEHHSNILPWREAGAKVIEINEGENGGPDLEHLEEQLRGNASSPLLIGSFSAASNVTGIISQSEEITRLLKRHGALSFWDYAGAGPYLDMDMSPAVDRQKDAIVISAHKFVGGPGASGVLIVRNSVVKSKKPTWPGGGSVAYVSPWAHDYLTSIVQREEAGTPNIVGDIRAAAVFLVKKAIGTEFIEQRDQQLRQRAEKTWGQNPQIQILGVDKRDRLPIFSLLVRNQMGGYIHHNLFTRMLSDISGVQARGGCVCAGPYGHRLLGVDRAHSEAIRAAVRNGREIEKPGWTRLNFNYLMDDQTADHIIKSVDELAKAAPEMAQKYQRDIAGARFFAAGQAGHTGHFEQRVG
ncbi:Cysteine desulfurase [hydrothermal vent metagenome]|uniref:Cysteine desulfurase n=1 Tax=hydrothermal vent metagenome TaxID=652676 RepID=A0A3B0TTZ8_9ZZZZ